MTQKQKNLDKYITLQQAARIYGCTQKHMALMARRGRLKAIKINGDWKTTFKWLKEYSDSVAEKIGGLSKIKILASTFKKVLVSLFVAILVVAFISIAYVSAKQGTLPILNKIKDYAENLVVNNIQSLNKPASSAVIETHKTLAFVFAANFKTLTKEIQPIFEGIEYFSRTAAKGFIVTTKTMALGVKRVDRNINNFMDSMFTDLGNSVMDFTYKTTDSIARTPKAVCHFFAVIFRTLYSFAPFNFFGFFASEPSQQTVLSVHDLYHKLKDLRELVEGKTIVVREKTQQIVQETTIIKPATLDAELAVFRSSILNQIASDMTNLESKIGQTLIVQNNYYYSEAAKTGGLNVSNNEVDFNENIDMMKNLSVLGTITGNTITGQTLISVLGTFTHASISDDLTISDVFLARDGLVSISDDFYVGNDMFFADISDNAIYSSASYNSSGAFNLDNTASVSGQVVLFRSPSLAHGFDPSWPAGTSNVLDSTLLINPATAGGDSNLLGLAVNDVVKFLVDAEGDIYGMNLIVSGSVSQGETVIAGNLTVQDSTTLGDSPADSLFINATINDSLISNYGLNLGTTLHVGSMASNSYTLSIDGTASISDSFYVMDNLLEVSNASVSFGGTGSVSFAGDLDVEGGLNIGAGKLYFDASSGNVGIGTTAPGAKLEINGGAGSTNGLKITNLGTADKAIDLTNSGLGNSDYIFYFDSMQYLTANGELQLGRSGSGTGYLSLYNRFKIWGHSGFDYKIATIGDGGNLFLESSGSSGTNAIILNPTTGNVGIGTTSPDYLLEVAGQMTASSSFVNGLANMVHASVSDDFELTSVASSSASFIRFRPETDSTTFFQITSAGFDPTTDNYPIFNVDTTNQRVGIGTTAPSGLLHLYGTAAANQYQYNEHVNDAGASYYALRRAKTGKTAVVNGNGLGLIVFEGYDGSAYREAAVIYGEIDGTPGSSDMPGRLTFYTTPDNSATSQERMRIDSTGNVGIGDTVPGYKLSVDGTASISDDFYVSGDDVIFQPYTDQTDAFIIASSGWVAGENPIFNVDTTNQRIGIGTSAPGAKLDVTGTMRVGTGSGAGSMSPLEIVEANGGLVITSTNTAAGTEAYVASFLKDASGAYKKAGADAWQWTDNNVTNGYASWNIHTSTIESSVQVDNIGLAVWAKHGAAFFSSGTTSANAPGLGIVRFNGDNNNNDTGQLLVAGASDANQKLSIGYNTTSDYGFISAYKTGSGYKSLILNPDGGNVGIGTTIPDTKLKIIKDTTTLSTEADYAIKIDDGTADTGLYLGVQASGNIGIIQVADPGTAWDTRNLAIMPNGGNVGIGTTVPQAQLQVGTTPDSSITANSLVHLASSTAPSLVNGFSTLKLDYTAGSAPSTPGAQIMFTQGYHPDNPDYTQPVGAIRGWKTGASYAYGGGLQLLYQPDSAALGLLVGMTLTGGGNVGIGTTGPQALTHIYNGASGGTAYSNSDLIVEDNDRAIIQLLAPNANDAYVMFGDANAGNRGYIGHYGSAVSPANLMVYYSVGDHSFSGGNVGIGDTTPDYLLDVAGTLGVDGNAYFALDVSALTFTDRTPYPKDLATAYEAIFSMQRLPDGEYDENDPDKQLDHSKLSDFVRGNDNNRNLSAAVSAQNEVLKDLIGRMQELEQFASAQATVEISHSLIPQFSLDDLINGLKQLGIIIENGIVKIAQLAVKTLIVEKNADATQSSIGEGIMKAESVSAEIRSNQIMPSSKIFITFRNDYGSRWWINYQEKGLAIINIADPAPSDLKFDWWIVQTEPVEITSTPAETPILEPVIEPVPTGVGEPIPTEQPTIEQPAIEQLMPVIESSTETPTQEEPESEPAPPQASIESQPTPEATAGEAMQ